MTANILTPLKPEWEKFISELIFHLHVVDGIEDTLFTNCDASFKICRNIISIRYTEFDLEETIDSFIKSGWLCDCAVFFDAPLYLGEPKEEMCCATQRI